MEKFDNLNGMVFEVVTTTDQETGVSRTVQAWRPGRILQLWRELTAQIGSLPRKDKPGVKFKVRSAEDMVDKLKLITNDLGIIIYPGVATHGEGKVVEDGTLADVNMVLIAQAVEDGSMLAFGGYGQGADNQDKAGGKAMTYAAKATLILAAQMGGTKTAKALGVHDTDDTDTPIKGGVRPKAVKATLESIRAQLADINEEEEYKELRPVLLALTPEDQLALADAITAAKLRAGMTVPAPKAKDAGQAKHS